MRSTAVQLVLLFVFALIGLTPFLFIMDGLYQRQLMKGIKLSLLCLCMIFQTAKLLSVIGPFWMMGLCLIVPIALFSLCFYWAQPKRHPEKLEEA